MSKPTFYISTPIYYPSDNLHIGHTYCTVAADAMARFKRETGYDVMFLTGTDEHGQKIEKKAIEAGVTPKEFVDNIVSGIKDLWKLMNISYDDFIRTTDKRHEDVVQRIFQKLYDKGDIYKGEYEGWYCTPCESFWLDRQLVNGMCPDCGRPVQKAKEESYFFRLSKYAPKLIELLENNPDFVQPQSRAKEMLQNFLYPGLEDLAVSRTSFKWGIPVPFDPKHVIYVWIDALSNYITALGYDSDDDSKYKKFWPADVHLVGKEIIRFHTIIWPAMLMALDLPLPKQVFGHGWVILEGGKMSKSKGNVIDPVQLAERYGVDSLRYFLLKDMPLGQDSQFSNEILINLINTDLANNIGNLLSRSVAMAYKYFDGIVPERGTYVPEEDDDLLNASKELPAKIEDIMNKMRLSDALEETIQYSNILNKYIDVTTPWVLAKDDSKKERLQTVIYNLLEGLRYISVILKSFLPETANKMKENLNVSDDIFTWESIREFGATKPGTQLVKMAPLFPRIDVEKELAELEAMKNAAMPKLEVKPEITYDEFDKIDLKTAKVLEAEDVKGSDKLIKLSVEVGPEKRTIVSGLRPKFTAKDMVGKTVVIVANLKPSKIKGIMSEGMLLAVGNEKVDALVTADAEVESGVSVH